MDEPNEKPLLTPEQEAILGSELSECLTLLQGQLAPYEEWARGGDFTIIELLQVLKEDGIFKDLKIIESLGKAVQARYAQTSAEAKKTYRGNPPERVKVQALEQLKDNVTALVCPDQPLMNEILNQTLDAGQAEMILSIADGILSRRVPGVKEEMRIKAVVEAKKNSQRLRNYCDLLVFLARCRTTTLECQKLSTPQVEAAEAAFEKYRWAEMELSRPDRIPGFAIAGADGRAMGLKVSLCPTTLGENAMFEAFRVVLSFSVDVPHPTTQGLYHQGTHSFESKSI